MPVNRRQFLRGAAAFAPAVILTPGLLMPVRTLSAAPVAGFARSYGFDYYELDRVYDAARQCGKVDLLTEEFYRAYIANVATLLGVRQGSIR